MSRINLTYKKINNEVEYSIIDQSIEIQDAYIEDNLLRVEFVEFK